MKDRLEVIAAVLVVLGALVLGAYLDRDEFDGSEIAGIQHQELAEFEQARANNETTKEREQ